MSVPAGLPDLNKKKKEFKPSMVLHEGKIFIAVEGEPDLVIQGKIHVDRITNILKMVVNLLLIQETNYPCLILKI